MYGIDTNILIRYLVKDDAKQSAQAIRFINQQCTNETPGFVNRIVLCELVWVLESAYEYSRNVTASALEKLLRVRQLIIEDLPCAWLALHDYQNKKLDFVDSFIAYINREHGCKKTITFDKKASKSTCFLLLT